MPVTVTGHVIDENGQAQAALLVGAFDTSGLFGSRQLPNTANQADPLFAAYAPVAADGSFTLTCASGGKKAQLRVVDKVGRVLLSPDPIAFTADVALAAPLVVSRASTDGWLATGGQFPAAVSGNSIDIIVDNHDAWQQIAAAVRAAKTSINFMLFFLDVGNDRMSFTPDMPDIAIGTGKPTPGDTLEDALTAAGDAGVVVRLCCNQLTAANGMVPTYFFDTAAAVFSYFDDPAKFPSITVRKCPTPMDTPIHTKFVVIDNSQAFVIGSPFVQDYYDECAHHVEDPRHGWFWFASRSQLQVPTHDVSLHMTGPAIQLLNQTFCTHWNYAKPDGTPDLVPDPAPAPTGAVTVQVTRSLQGNNAFSGLPQGEATILESYLRAIKNAQDFIYLENQYFTSSEIVDALIFAMKQLPVLQLILLTNNKVDIPGYSGWQPAALQKLLTSLTAEERLRVGLFTVWSHEPATQHGGLTRFLRTYIHSKVAIIDDTWATVGSANLDGVSLSASQHATASRSKLWFLGSALAGLRSKGDPTQCRESDTNIAFGNNIAGSGGTATTLPADLRRRLWAEHLGLTDSSGAPDPTSPALATRPPLGWLSMWTTAAFKKLQGLQANPVTIAAPRILAYPQYAGTPAEQKASPGQYPEVPKVEEAARYLTMIDVDSGHLDARETFRRFNFQTSNWG